MKTKIARTEPSLQYARERLLANIEAEHEAYYQAKLFGGPSLYFHLRSLDASRAKDFERFSEYSYAVLAAWGMHRMGPRGPKMLDYQQFTDSLRHVWPVALQLQTRSPSNLSESGWHDLKEVFSGIRCMASDTKLVGNAKVMAHLLPNLVPPIDREYTLKFLFGHTRIARGIEIEWEKLKQILGSFFYPVTESRVFQSKASKWIAQNSRFEWDTSALKVIDNLIIGFSKMPR